MGLTVRWWAPWTVSLAVQKKGEFEALNSLAELISKIVTWAGAVGMFVYGLWLRKKERATSSAKVAVSEVTGNSIVGEGNIQSGGVNFSGVGLVSIAAPVADGNVISGDQVQTGGTKIERQTIIYQQASTPVLTALRSLPPPPADFTGRDDELKELLAMIKKGGATISGLQGQGGVGKTALALNLAEKLTPDFPDAQIYINLLGASEKPLTSADAMTFVIRAFHPEDKLSEEESQLSALYQSALNGKKALLLMDNARDAAQVKPLIPPKSCVLLVTSRFYFALPGFHSKRLDTLPPDKAEGLLLTIEPRIDGESAAIAKLCGYLPQALRLAATALTERMNITAAEYRQRLAEERNRPKLLSAGNESVEASISLSYELLPDDTRKHWRKLGVFPETFDGVAATAVLNIQKAIADDELGKLLQFSMLEWNDKNRRYRLHDLMRDFARQNLTPQERADAGLRHSKHYLGVLRNANDLYNEGGEALRCGLGSFDLERGNIEAGQAWAAEQATSNRDAAELCSAYPIAGAYCLYLRQNPRESISWREAALAAATQLNAPLAVAAHLGNLGLAYDALGEHRRAIEYHLESLKLEREFGHREGEGRALGNLGNAYHALGEYQRSIELQSERLNIARELSDRWGEGQALGNLGIGYYKLGDYPRAIDFHEQNLKLAREVHDPRGENAALWNLSLALDKIGNRKEAIRFAEDSLKIHEEIKDPFAEHVREQLRRWREESAQTSG